MQSEFEKFFATNNPLTPNMISRGSIILGFKYFTHEMCKIIFNNYIQHPTIHDSIFATVITSILENKIKPNDIFHKQCDCQEMYCQFYISKNNLKNIYTDYSCDCKQKIPHCYTYNFRTTIGFRMINLHLFQDYSLDMFLDLL